MYDMSTAIRSLIGLDSILNSFAPVDTGGFPPYNIEKLGSGGDYCITLALAGFDKSEIDIETDGDYITISAKKEEKEDLSVKYLHKGIAYRSFARRFRLADHVFIDVATFDNGLLRVFLKTHLPEQLRPKKIPISSGLEP